MARIPIERRDRGGAWWWVLVVAVIGLVVWLVYEWFDNDYYEDYRYTTNETPDEVVPAGEPGTANGVTGTERGAAGRVDRGVATGAAVGGGAVLTSLDPLTSGSGWRGYVDRPVQVDDLRVDRMTGDRAFTVNVRGAPVLVVGDDANDFRDVRAGSVVDIDQGRVVPADVDELQRLGVDPAAVGRSPFYIRAEDISVAG